MKYEDAIRMAEPSQAIKEKFYQDFIKPHLTREPDPQMYDYFLHAGYQAWRFDVNKEDIKNILFVVDICERLEKNDKIELFSLLGGIFSEHENARVRKKESERNYYESGNNIETKFVSAVRHYKVFFESEFRLWGTIPYYFVCKIMGVKTKGNDTDSFINIAASEKLFAIKGVNTLLPKGDVKDLIKGFDNEVRNAGEGHDSYEITDDDTILLKVIDPKTGKQKGSKQIEFTYSELNELIRLCRKSIWVLETGVMIYFNNNPEVRKSLTSNKPLKIREIKRYLSTFAYNRWFLLEDFNYDKSNNNISFKLKYTNKKIGKSGELLFSTGERFDLIDVETTVGYKEQVLGVIQHLVSMILPAPLPSVNCVVSDGSKTIADLDIEPKELVKLVMKKAKENIPALAKGSYPEGEYSMINAVKVPYGMKDIMKIALTAKGFKVVN